MSACRIYTIIFTMFLMVIASPVLAESLTGMDNNNNGIRDDLEPVIAKRYTDKREQAAAGYLIQQVRKGLDASDGFGSMSVAVDDVSSGLECAYTVFGAHKAKREIDFLLNRMIDNADRAQAWIPIMNKISGKPMSVGNASACP